MATSLVFYNFGSFTILAYTPLLLDLTAHQLGLVYFGWGVLVALTSVFGAQRLERRFGLVSVLGRLPGDWWPRTFLPCACSTPPRPGSSS